jgi:DNA-binding transcriptional regulator GbsR (MarR family)
MPASEGADGTPNGLSKTRREMIEAGGRLCQLLGLPRSTGQIFGLLYLSPRPLSLADLGRMLGISKASASTGTRQLRTWGAIRQVWVPGERRDYFEAVADFGQLVRAGYLEHLKPRLLASQRRLEAMAAALDQEHAQGTLDGQEYELCAQRVKKLAELQRRLLQLAPLAEQLFEQEPAGDPGQQTAGSPSR